MHVASLLLFLLLDIDAAEKALQAGKPREAIRLLGDLANGDDPRANAVLGRAHVALREYAAAVEPLLIASDADAKDKKLAAETASACWGAARAAARNADPFARAYYEDAIRMSKRAQRPGQLAPLQLEAGYYEDALETYRELADTPKTRKGIADALKGLGQGDQAEKAYAAALELALLKRDLQVAYQTAFLARRGGQLVQWLGKELLKKPDDKWIRLYRGYAHARLQMDAQAVVDLRLACKEFPKDLFAKDLFCRSLIRWGVAEQRPEAFDEMEGTARVLMVAGDPNGKTHLFWLASSAWLNRDVERSYALLKELFGSDQGDKNVGLNFGAMGRRLNRLDEAEKTYRTLLEAYPDDPDVLNDLGILTDGRGDRAGAVTLWKRVLAEDPEDLNALENLFTAAWERGDRDAAARYLKSGMRLAQEQGGGLLVRWQWFSDRLGWAPAGHAAVADG